MTLKTSICVDYKSADGWHIFESAELRGLYVASRDAETAYNDVAPAIERLLLLDNNIVVKATPEVSLQEFIESTEHGKIAASETKAFIARAQRFAVLSEVAA